VLSRADQVYQCLCLWYVGLYHCFKVEHRVYTRNMTWSQLENCERDWLVAYQRVHWGQEQAVDSFWCMQFQSHHVLQSQVGSYVLTLWWSKVGDLKAMKGIDLWLIEGHILSEIKLLIASDAWSIGLYTCFNLKSYATVVTWNLLDQALCAMLLLIKKSTRYSGHLTARKSCLMSCCHQNKPNSYYKTKRLTWRLHWSVV
jgi:hypothetical protein